MHSIYDGFISYLKDQYPKTDAAALSRLTPNIVSPFTIKLPRAIFEQAQNIVRDLHQLAENTDYQNLIKGRFPFSDFQKTPSVLSSLDVHIAPGGQLKIIEVNTNASSYLMNLANYKSRQVPTFPHARQQILETFQKAWSSLKPGDLVLILDEAPEKQNLYAEFLLFKELFEKELGVRCEIADPQNLTVTSNGTLMFQNTPVAGIYNRHTDFYFDHTPALKTAFAHQQTFISPNPWGYALWADKNRLIEWPEVIAQLRTKGLSLDHLEKALLEVRKFSSFSSPDELWSQRSKYFLKPANSFGGKSVYKGKSISRTTFDRIYNGDYLAQALVPAPEVQLHHNGTDYKFKYDLRFYFFEGEIQLGAARLYQGQLTNLQTPFGGLAPLEIH